MPNFFTDNSDILFHLEHLDLKEIVHIIEDDFEESKKFNYAPVNLEDAMENYRKVLEVVGDIAGNFIEPRAADVDLEGAHYQAGEVKYAKGTQENIDELAKADLMGMVL
ncbi:MAG TPA: acyl-CoA dehydrogenase, partial [Ignavibacteria bacterium]|nr:acyl-CoA dehydrogenase [Ignavibacteria bacterium]